MKCYKKTKDTIPLKTLNKVLKLAENELKTWKNQEDGLWVVNFIKSELKIK